MLIAGILILFLALSYFIVLQPKLSSVQDAIRSGLASQQSLAAASAKKLASYQAMNDIYKKINPADLQRFNTVLPDNYDQERLFGEIEEMLSRGGWLLNSLNISQPEEAEVAPDGEAPELRAALTDKRIGAYTLDLSVSAIDYAGLKNLLKIFENNLRLLDVAKVNFSPANSSAQITLTTYYYRAQ